MPSPTDIKRAFKLHEILDVKKLHLDHKCIKQNEIYKFPITLEFQPNLTPREMKKRCLEKTHGKKLVVYSHYGSPYECTSSDFTIKGSIAHAEIVAKRSRTIPTLAQVAEANRKKNGTDEVGERTLTPAQQARWRVIKSR